ncbi:MAG: ActD-like protein [Deltaproteobacteria bacterium]|nr:ActD-like protein [Deltaproteobacteria bacterium]
MTTPNSPIPEWKLERLALGELPEAEAAELRTRIEADPAEAARLAALEESNRAILAAHPAEELARAIERRRHLQEVTEREAGRQRSSRPLLWGLPTLAAAAALAVFLLRGPPPVGVDPNGGLEHTTIKGLDARLHVHRKTAAGDEELTSGALARPGDLLQVAYTAAGKHHGLILSLDGRGTLTDHLAGRGGLHSVPLEPSGKVSLDRAYELDDAPRFERFYFFVSDEPFEASALRAALEQGQEGDALRSLLPQGIDFLRFDLRKETP